MDWIRKNKKTVAAIAAALLGVFYTIADLTGTKTDDKIADKLKAIELKEKLEAIANEPDAATNAVDVVGSTE